MFGLAQALGSSTDYEKGLPTARRLRDIDLPLLADIPEIIVEFIRSDEDPGGCPNWAFRRLPLRLPMRCFPRRACGFANSPYCHEACDGISPTPITRRRAAQNWGIAGQSGHAGCTDHRALCNAI